MQPQPRQKLCFYEKFDLKLKALKAKYSHIFVDLPFITEIENVATALTTLCLLFPLISPSFWGVPPDLPETPRNSTLDRSHEKILLLTHATIFIFLLTHATQLKLK